MGDCRNLGPYGLGEDGNEMVISALGDLALLNDGTELCSLFFCNF